MSCGMHMDAIRHVKIKTTVFNMLKRLDKIRSRGQRTDVFLDLGDSPNTSDTECSEEILMKPRPSLEMKDTEEVQDPAGPGTLTMPAAAIQDYQRAETDRLNDLKGHLEIALLEKHFLLLSHCCNSRMDSGEAKVESRASSETRLCQATLLLDTMPAAPMPAAPMPASPKPASPKPAAPMCRRKHRTPGDHVSVHCARPTTGVARVRWDKDNPVAAGCDTARICSDAASTAMQCLRPLRHSGGLK
ncbi:uncharacterized protein ACWYII_016781 isoform 2-T2 [Salvelinus alpinus]